ncbi:TerC family protein [Candidatus Sumerlaeota bacterium]|nr:TerC family protein [Candidatus Sumerlaeota bacterium]
MLLSATANIPADAALLSMDNLLALLTLTALEIVLGIDNIVVIAIVTGKLPKDQQGKARTLGLALAMIMRVLLLLCISWLMGMTKILFTAFGQGFTGKDLILLTGGLFLIAKATHEIHHNIEGPTSPEKSAQKAVSNFGMAIAMILAMDMVFSLDSVITAVGMANDVKIMITAIILAVIMMMIFSGGISRFIEGHPTIKILALSFLLLIGVMLTVEGGLDHAHIDKKYIYFAMGFSLVVELINLRILKKQQIITIKS